jgi:hypothetical protein
MNDIIATKMPHGPSWKSDMVVLPDAPDELQLFLYRNPVECVQYLIGKPSLKDVLDYWPVEIYDRKPSEGGMEWETSERIFIEMNSGKIWNEQQVSVTSQGLLQVILIRLLYSKETLPAGATILSIILALDKTHLTNFSGDKSIHAVYQSIGNIHKAERRKLSRHCWLLLAEIPTPNFTKSASKFWTRSHARHSKKADMSLVSYNCRSAIV